MVSFASFVVVPDDRQFRPPIEQPVFELVTTGRQWLRQLPDDYFHDGPIIVDLL